MCRASLPLLRPPAALLLFLMALASTGCVPSLTWLPDSSGFICTAGKENTRLIHYDLGKGESHVLVEDTGAGTDWPAVSPDGKQIAVARVAMKPGEKQKTLQVILYNLAGKERKRSIVFDWLEAENQNPKALPQLFWAPQSEKILVTTFAYTAIYDVKADRLVHAGEGWLLTFGTTPVRPDGTGFLLMKNRRPWLEALDKKEKAPDPGFTFVDWNGMETPLKPPAQLGDEAALAKQRRETEKLIGLLFPYMFKSGWTRDVAQVSLKGDRLRYLTGKGEVVLDRIEPAKTKDGLPIYQQYSFPGGQVKVRLIEGQRDEKNPRQAALLSTAIGIPNPCPPRVEVLKAGQKEPKVLVDNSFAVFAPSPNGKLLALRLKEAVTVVNDQGEVVARVPLNR